MKQVTNMSRLTNQLEKMFRLLNKDFFNDALNEPIITVTPSARSYAHYTPWNAWSTKESQKREINIASGTLDRPLENVVSSLLHEMVHMYNDTVLNVQDCSRSNSYHNKYFKREAEKHGLICIKTDHGWSQTAPSDSLIEWLLLHDEFNEIEMCRINSSSVAVRTGTHTSDGGIKPTQKGKTHHRKYICPNCKNSVRATKLIRIICGDCMTSMIEQ